VTDGTLNLVIERFAAGPVEVELRDADLTVRPDDAGRLLLRASTDVAGQSSLEMTGVIDLERWTWRLKGRATGVDTSGPLVDLATAYSPDVSRQLAAWSYADGRGPIRTASLEDAASTAAEPPFTPESLPLALAIEADVDFDVALPDPAGDIRFRVVGDARAGRVEHPRLPFPLDDVAGRISVTNAGLRIENLVGRHDGATFDVAGELAFPADAGRVVPASSSPGQAGAADAFANRFTARLDDVELTPEVLAVLPGGVGQVMRSLDPQGRVDVTLAAEPRAGSGAWDLSELHVKAVDAAVRPKPFPLAVTGVTGEVRLVEADRIGVSLSGVADGYPVDCVGTIIRRGDGPGQVEAAIRLTAAEAALTPAVAAACPPQARDVFRMLGLAAEGAVEVGLYRAPVSMAPLQWTLATEVSDGSVRHESFPYDVRGVTGRVTYDAVRGRWNFEGLRGRHGDVAVSADGNCVRTPDGYSLDVDLDVENCPLDRDLFAAISDELRAAWRHLRPTGVLGGPVDLTWRTGEYTEIALPDLRWTGGTLNSVGFPYFMERIDADLAYKNGTVTVTRFDGRHGPTTVGGRGRVVVADDGGWDFRIDRLDVDELRVDDDLKRAVSPTLREFFEAANPRGPLTLDGAIALRGRADTANVAAAWDLETRFGGADWTFGVDVSDTAGVVRCRGTFDGVDSRFDGLIDLDHATVLEQRAVDIRGPFRYRGGKLVVGSPRVFGLVPGGTADIPAADRLSGELIGGAWTVDVLVEPTAGGSAYAVRSTLSGGRLRDYTSLAGVDTLRGVVNGWVDVRGTVPFATPIGTDPPVSATIGGRGQVEVSPAALYELPVLVETFKVLNFRPPDRTAFHFAFADFRINDSGFVFDTIDLVGDAISMRGRGTAGWDETLDLFLYSFAPQQRFTVPVIGQLWNRATAGWVGVEVTGTINEPAQRVVGAPMLNDAVRGFLNTFDPNRREPPVLNLESLPVPTVPQSARRGGRGWSGSAVR
ncbi:MAG: hypothetical protein AAGJ97_01300, partial [Planctomycetota bacterium]